MPASWLRYPAKTIRQPTACPTRRTRFRTRDLALASLPVGAHIHIDAEPCDVCGGWHRTP